MQTEELVGVLLLNTGTPSEPTPKAVKRYLAEFLMDPKIRPLPKPLWWFILHAFILPKRKHASAEKYQKIWTPEGSPFLIAHERLASGLNAHYRQSGQKVLVEPAMSYGEPSIAEALRHLRAAGCARVVALPLYPQSAYSTVGAVEGNLRHALKHVGWKVPLELIDNYHDNATYLRAIAASIENAGFQVDSDDRLLFSFHSIPLADIETGDTYELQTDATSLCVANELGIDRKRWTIGYQCRFDKEREWLSPFTVDVLGRWAESGEGRVFFICPNFAVDCLETLYDIEYEIRPHYEQALRAAGKPVEPDSFVYVPCLDKSKAHLKVLADVLKPHVER